jgi:hypothetical protein
MIRRCTRRSRTIGDVETAARADALDIARFSSPRNRESPDAAFDVAFNELSRLIEEQDAAYGHAQDLCA